jgi:hypothetical protein
MKITRIPAGRWTAYIMRDPRCWSFFGHREGNRKAINKVCGELTVDTRPEGLPFAQVKGIAVEPNAQRGKLGVKVMTKLYEFAAADVCKRNGRPLASDTQRAPSSEAFWRKQFRKGRAERYGKREKIDPPGYWPHYVLACPSPKSLSGFGKLPTNIDRRSIRRRNVYNGHLLFGCPKGKWQPRKQRCKAAMRLIEKKVTCPTCRRKRKKR